MQFTGSKLKALIRPSLTIIFGFLGVLVARGATPPDILAITGKYFLVVAAIAFGVLGFLLPDILEIAGRSAIAAIALQVARRIPTPTAPRLSVPKLSFSRRKKKNGKYINPLVVDTSVLIDGRISDVIKTGFIFGSLLVIPSVVSELHTLSDSADELKRAKGRRGLDILKSLKSEKKVKLEVLKEDPSGDTVDDKLITLGRKLRGQVMTMDFNLNKVAAVKGVSVLNLNELINALKTAVLPHEILTIQVKSHGKGKNQGVGYLPDGTMVVVEDGAEAIGKSLNVVVLRVIQTAAGKMIFARLQE
ncbi:hypothetical protein A2870_04265 [Candidatus Curtissbacteria bacterium RIFCSPHIGHO2_01_FULL_41_11]|uniref:TRAM domain-containing protein n=1 Tax=Candidatus Curtissbacteria bacterium RIFCSPHIGHO2_01_FULL_41_11 TaxID=1797711 RepID=A0A1F5G4L8_9BACT|nr:MAG: hypothetical protein A2870_04265 [Candidatus Curtissbacteria bacterium RIFCSPHIGHO2_01_FULL_41_11]